MDNNQLQMELELSKRIEKLEVVAEVITRLILWIIYIFILYMESASKMYKDYFTIYNLWKYWPVTTVCPISFYHHCSVAVAVLIGTSVIIVTQIVISAILNYFDLLFSPFLLFNFSFYQSSTLIGWSHYEKFW